MLKMILVRKIQKRMISYMLLKIIIKLVKLKLRLGMIAHANKKEAIHLQKRAITLHNQPFHLPPLSITPPKSTCLLENLILNNLGVKRCCAMSPKGFLNYPTF